MGTVSFEPFTLPFNGTGQVDIVEGGTVCVGLKETSDEEEAPSWYVLTSSGGDLVCVESGLETWLTTAREAPAVVKTAGARALVRQVPDRFAGCPLVLAAWSGSVTLARAADGSFYLRALDTESGKVLHARFRTAMQGVTPPPQPMEEPQTSSCSAECETGSCSVTCVGKKAECYCKDGSPYCYCGRKMSIEILPPPPF